MFAPHPARVDGSAWRLTALGPALLALGLGTALALWARRRVPALLVGWLWFLGMLVPMIGLVQVGAQAYADRYTYLPLIGIELAVVFGGAALFEKRPRLRPAAPLLSPPTAPARRHSEANRLYESAGFGYYVPPVFDSLDDLLAAFARVDRESQIVLASHTGLTRDRRVVG